MNQKELLKLLQMVQKNVRCPQCGRKYSFSDIKINGIVDTICFLELRCTEHMPLIATVVFKPNNSFYEKQQNHTGVKIDDVIEIYKFLKEFKGGFEEKFKSTSKNK